MNYNFVIVTWEDVKYHCRNKQTCKLNEIGACIAGACPLTHGILGLREGLKDNE